jgi:PAS domain S-box-containing protein
VNPRDHDRHVEEFSREAQKLHENVFDLEGLTKRLQETRAALKSSDERYRLAMEAVSDGVWDWDLEKNTVYRSPAYFSMLGYAPDEFSSSPEFWKTVIHPDDLERVQELLDAYLHGRRRDYEVEYRMISKSGDPVWVLSRGRITARDANGAPLRFVGTHTNITARKTAEDRLRYSETTARRKLEAILSPEADIRTLSLADILDPDAMQALLGEFSRLTGVANAIIDLQGAVLVANRWQDVCVKFHRVHPETCRNCVESDTVLCSGVTPGEYKLYRCKNLLWDAAAPIMAGDVHVGNIFLGQFFFDDEEIDYERFRAQARRYGFEEEEYLAALARVPRLSRETVRTVMSFYAKLAELISRLGYGHIKLARGLVERNALLESIERNEANLRSLFDAISESVFLIKSDGTVLAANKVLAERVGLTVDEIIGRRSYDLLPPDKAHTCKTWIDETVRTGKPLVREDELNGRLQRYSIYPVLNSEGKVDRVAVYAEDITERTRAEEERRRLETDLQQARKMEAVGTLAGGVAHDFNNILQVVLGYAQLLLFERTPDSPDYEEISNIETAALRGADLVQRLLMFSRRVAPEPVLVDLNERILYVEKLLARIIPRMISIRLDLQTGLPRVMADPVQIEQVLMNLAVNARDAMPDGGTLTFRTEEERLERDYCSAHPEAAPGPHVVLAVSDTGEGISQDIMERLFDPFFTTKEAGRGTGLGLATVYGIVKQHGGHIQVFSQPGAGAEFRIYLPAHHGEEQIETAHSQREVTGGNETILLVDDDPAIRGLAVRILEQSGYKIVTAADGMEAVETYRRMKDEIALVILDMIMPEMSGAKCLDRMVAIDSNVKALIASGFSKEGLSKNDFGPQVKGFIGKPFDLAKLRAAVREALDHP